MIIRLLRNVFCSSLGHHCVALEYMFCPHNKNYRALIAYMHFNISNLLYYYEDLIYVHYKLSEFHFALL